MSKLNEDTKGLQKSSSLQQWSKLTQKYFHKKLRIEERKDREYIYNLLKKNGLPYERFYAFPSGDKLTKDEFLKVIGDLGYAYWISATPKLGLNNLDRLSKLRLENIEDGWNFIKSIPELASYKIIIMQYADNPEFKGNVLISKNLNGIADFVQGDRHVQLTSGLTISDPMFFNSQEIVHFSETISKEYQELLYSYISMHPGHFEFQYGTLDKVRGLSFFDYNEELAYEDIDKLFQDLVVYHDLNLPSLANNGFLVLGIPASLGKATGICKVILSEDVKGFRKVSVGNILVTDATTPDMTPIMKKVSAIVTDFGGVTSHAAIVCRELGIPCIVGTRKGTSLLKDGMKVEVDAFKGTVKEAK